MGNIQDQIQVHNEAGGCGEHRRQARDVRRVNRRPLWQWNRIFHGGPYTPRRINFTRDERILKPLPANPIAEDFFKIDIDKEIIDHIVEQTNLYTERYIERETANLRAHSLVKEWKPTDRAEMLTFLTMLILMGINS